MNHNVTLTITSLITILLSSFHLADDVVRGIEPGGTSNYTGVVILAVYLYATLMLAKRRWAHMVVLIGSIGAVFFWVWTLMALGATAIVSVILAAHRLWRLQTVARVGGGSVQT